jgi:hypothetical protein
MHLISLIDAQDLITRRKPPDDVMATDRQSAAGRDALIRQVANRRWLRREKPFPHIIATNVFSRAFYRSLEREFYRQFEQAAPGGLNDPSLKMRGYDAYGLHFSPNQSGPFSIFVSRAWHDLMASLFNVNACGFINAGLHHHLVGSGNGRVHTDLSIGWFVDYPSRSGIRVSRHDLCHYTDGAALAPGVRPFESVRAVSMLFYLANPPWSPGDGGETGLYQSSQDPVDSPAFRMPPINNSILLFECTPHSYHSFLRNNKSVRNSIIMWIHSSKDQAIARWGDDALVRFPTGMTR